MTDIPARWRVIERFVEAHEKAHDGTVVWVRPNRHKHLVTITIHTFAPDGKLTSELRDWTWEEMWKSYTRKENA